MLKKTTLFLTFTALFLSNIVVANEVEIVKVVLTKHTGTWRADVTLKHNDSGWKHYADAWRLIDGAGNEIGKRTLYHPHVNEQPFTRSLRDLHIANSIKTIFVEAHDLKHGWSKNKVKVDMKKSNGKKYTIIIR